MSACKMGRSSLSGQPVCLKCGDECECYVCIGTTTLGGEDPPAPEHLPKVLREILYDLVDPTKDVKIDGDGEALARILAEVDRRTEDVAFYTVEHAIEEDMDISDAYRSAIARWNFEQQDN